MIALLPPLYPDELLYSLLGRVHWLTCSDSPKQTLDELFGNRRVRAGVVLQANLAHLCAHFPPQRKLTPEKLARDATLFVYLTAFHPNEVRDWALTILTEGNAGAVHVRLGLVAGAVQQAAHLRYCPACRAEMLTIFGELYWMRAHQLPGVLVCPVHGVPLADSRVHPAAMNQHEYISADEVNCPPDPPQPSWALKPAALKLLRDIAQASVAVLTNPPPAQPLEWWRESYRTALVRRGFSKGISHINQESLLDAYLAYFGPILSILPEAAPNLWLAGMTRKQRKTVAPLRHVLLRLLLDALPFTEPSQPLGCGPWPCRNRLAEHYGQTVIRDCHTHEEGGKTIGVFRCSCEYSFSQAAQPGSKVRILNLGPLFDDRLRELLAVGTGLRATARALYVDTNTVLRYVDKLQLTSPWKPLPQRYRSPRFDREYIRARWSAAYRKAPELSRKQLRARLPAEYAWLYRHDHDWLEAHSPSPIHSHGGRHRRDWSMIDLTMSAELRASAARLQSETPPVPITRATLQGLLGKPDWLNTRLRKLPLCATALDELTETVEAFQCRRIAWAVDELHRTGKPVIAWRLRRLAGLSAQCTPLVEAALGAAEDKAS